MIDHLRTIQDPDGPEIAEIFYGHLFRNVDPTSSPPVFPDLNESAEALHLTVAKLRSTAFTLGPFRSLRRLVHH